MGIVGPGPMGCHQGSKRTSQEAGVDGHGRREDQQFDLEQKSVSHSSNWLGSILTKVLSVKSEPG